MTKRYRKTFRFFDSEEQARAFCDKENLNRYIREKHKATYTSWTSQDKTESKYIAWYVTK